MPVQNRKFDGWGPRKREGLWISFEKSEFLVSPEMKNSHWLQDNKR